VNAWPEDRVRTFVMYVLNPDTDSKGLCLITITKLESFGDGFATLVTLS